MKYLTERKQIAQAMNFGRYPVLRIDLETPQQGWDDCFAGDKVMVDAGSSEGRGDYVRCQLHKFGDEPKRYTVMPEPLFLDSSFGYTDVKEMLTWAQAPVIRPEETVIVIEDFPKKKICRVHKMKVSKCNGKFVYPTCYLEEIEE